MLYIHSNNEIDKRINVSKIANNISTLGDNSTAAGCNSRLNIAITIPTTMESQLDASVPQMSSPQTGPPSGTQFLYALTNREWLGRSTPNFQIGCTEFHLQWCVAGRCCEKRERQFRGLLKVRTNMKSFGKS